jgi:UPF0755 protein
MSKGTVLGIVLVLALLAGIGATVGYAAWTLSGEATGDELVVRVPDGATASAIGDLLEEEGVVRSSLAFSLRARSVGLDRQLQAGRYEFRTGMGVEGAIDVLLTGPMDPDAIRFTVAEGLTLAETLDRLADQTPYSVDEYREVIDGGELDVPDWFTPPEETENVREPYEGVLFPETYEVAEEASARDILQRMVDQLAAVADAIHEEGEEAATDRGLDRYEMLIVASLIEREAAIAEERPTISGVIVNRLEAGARLEMDAALLYAADARGERVRGEIRRIDSPYNLYEVDGLPPTPIGGVGRAALEAAYQPEEHDYLYYVKVDHEGRHAFAETFEEHQQNVQRLRELQDDADLEEGEPVDEDDG